MSIFVYLYFEEKEDGNHRGEMGNRGFPCIYHASLILNYTETNIAKW